MFTGYAAQNLVQRDCAKHVQAHTYIDTNMHFAHASILTDDTKLNLQTNSDLGWGRQQHGAENMADVLFWKKKCLKVTSDGVHDPAAIFFFRQEGQGHSMQKGLRHTGSQQQQHLHSGHGSSSLNSFYCVILK